MAYLGRFYGVSRAYLRRIKSYLDSHWTHEMAETGIRRVVNMRKMTRETQYAERGVEKGVEP